MLQRLRASFEASIGRRAASVLSKVSPDPNVYTLAGLGAAIASPVLAYTGYQLSSIALMALSMALDAVDGAVARYTGRASRLGAFIDSASDRVSDAAYHILLLVLGLNPLLVVVMLGGSMIIPYLRAKGEALGIYMAGHGLMERGERSLALLALAILAVISIRSANIAGGAVALLVWATVAQRVWRIYAVLKSEEES